MHLHMWRPAWRPAWRYLHASLCNWKTTVSTDLTWAFSHVGKGQNTSFSNPTRFSMLIYKPYETGKKNITNQEG